MIEKHDKKDTSMPWHGIWNALSNDFLPGGTGMGAQFQKIEGELDQIQTKLNYLDHDVNQIKPDLEQFAELEQIDKDYADVLTWVWNIKYHPDNRDDLANDMLRVEAMRNRWLQMMMGQLSTGGKTIVEVQQDRDKEHVPQAFMQKLVKTMAVMQYLLSWAYTRLNQIGNRKSESRMEYEYDRMWRKNEHVFTDVGMSCTWTENIELNCNRMSTIQAAKTYTLPNGTKVASEPQKSMPSHGSPHGGGFGFDLQCAKDDVATGIFGKYYTPKDYPSHSRSYITHFSMHCADGSNSRDQLDYTLGHIHAEQSFDVKLQEPMSIISGCTSQMVYANTEETYLALGVTISSYTSRDSKSISPPHHTACSAPLGSSFDMTCPPGTAFWRLQGKVDSYKWEADYDPKPWPVSEMTGTCVAMPDLRLIKPKQDVVLV